MERIMGKHHKVITILIILLLLGLFSACEQKYPEEKMTADQVINIVWVYGVPTFPVHTSPRPTGQWAAVYEGEGKWRIQGTVTVQRRLTLLEYETVSYQTTWSYSNNKVILTRYQP